MFRLSRQGSLYFNPHSRVGSDLLFDKAFLDQLISIHTPA